MDIAGQEVSVILKPRNSPDESQRVIKINPSQKLVNVGRASKNATKGLIAAKDNAWFDSPIMSRQHAKFYVSANHKGICLQDCGSTHGTYVGDHRLPPHEDHVLLNDEHITFGVRVTSGALTYPAKEFNVSLEWQPWAPDPPPPSPQRLVSPNTQFRVPDEDYDSLSDGSEEDSVQILDSHVRAYSVPSSDDLFSDEEEEIHLSQAKAKHNDKNSDKMITVVPESQSADKTMLNQPIQLWNEPTPQEELELLGPIKLKSQDLPGQNDDTGTSHFNPIDLECSPPQVTLTNNNNSDAPKSPPTMRNQASCEGPASAPFPTSTAENTANGGSPPERDNVASEQSGPESTDHDSDSDSDIDGNSDGISDSESGEEGNAETSDFKPRPASPVMHIMDSLQGKFTGNPTYDFDSDDEDDLEADDFFPIVSENSPERSSVKALTHCDPQVTSGHFKPYISSNLDQNANVEHTFSRSVGGFACRTSCGATITDVNQENHDGLQRAPQRPPSPSDAALARKANATGYPKPGLPLAAGHQSFSPVQEFSKYRELSPKPDSVRAEAGSVDFNSSHSIRDYYFDGYDPEWGAHYGEERFGSRIHRDGRGFPFYPQRENSYLNEQSHHDPTSVASWPTAYSCNTYRYNLWQYPSVANDNNNNNRNDNLTVAPPQNLQKEPDINTSRLNIADIVNPHADASVSLRKRKADEMDPEQDEKQTVEESHTSSAETSEYLPDAQPHDNLLIEDKSFLEEPEILSEATPRTDVSENVDFVEPPRKKTKIAPSTAINFSKFVSGVCVGVAGVLAAFIATIPMSIQEEVLQELENSA